MSTDYTFPRVFTFSYLILGERNVSVGKLHILRNRAMQLGLAPWDKGQERNLVRVVANEHRGVGMIGTSAPRITEPSQTYRSFALEWCPGVPQGYAHVLVCDLLHRPMPRGSRGSAPHLVTPRQCTVEIREDCVFLSLNDDATTQSSTGGG